MCSVKILNEVILGDMLSDVRPSSHCKFCGDPLGRETDVKTAVDRKGNILTQVSMASSPQVDTDCRPQVDTDCRPQVDTDCRPQVTTDCRPQVTTDCRIQVTTDCRPQVTTDVDHR